VDVQQLVMIPESSCPFKIIINVLTVFKKLCKKGQVINTFQTGACKSGVL